MIRRLLLFLVRFAVTAVGGRNRRGRLLGSSGSTTCCRRGRATAACAPTWFRWRPMSRAWSATCSCTTISASRRANRCSASIRSASSSRSRQAKAEVASRQATLDQGQRDLARSKALATVAVTAAEIRAGSAAVAVQQAALDQAHRRPQRRQAQPGTLDRHRAGQRHRHQFRLAARTLRNRWRTHHGDHRQRYVSRRRLF